MRFSPQEEYGLRCLIAVAKASEEKRSLTIPELSELEKIPEPTVAKILRQLRIGGFLKSVRGHTGGYSLARNPEKILISDVLLALGGRLFDEETCNKFSGDSDFCIHIKNCNVRKLWQKIQSAVDTALQGITLEDLLQMK